MTSDITAFCLVWKMASLSHVFQVQLSVTPIAEGTLEILGARWKLSGTIVGFHSFDSHSIKRNIVKGKRKANRSPKENLKFMVIKVHASIYPFNIIALTPTEFHPPPFLEA